MWYLGLGMAIAVLSLAGCSGEQPAAIEEVSQNAITDSATASPTETQPSTGRETSSPSAEPSNEPTLDAFQIAELEDVLAGPLGIWGSDDLFAATTERWRNWESGAKALESAGRILGSEGSDLIAASALWRSESEYWKKAMKDLEDTESWTEKKASNLLRRLILSEPCAYAAGLQALEDVGVDPPASVQDLRSNGLLKSVRDATSGSLTPAYDQVGDSFFNVWAPLEDPTLCSLPFPKGFPKFQSIATVERDQDRLSNWKEEGRYLSGALGFHGAQRDDATTFVFIEDGLTTAVRFSTDSADDIWMAMLTYPWYGASCEPITTWERNFNLSSYPAESICRL